MSSGTPQTPYRRTSSRGTLAEGVAIREDQRLPAGHWMILKPGEDEIFCHGRAHLLPKAAAAGHPHRPFTPDTIATEIIEYGNRSFAVAPSLYSLSYDVLEELTKRPALAPMGVKVTTEDAMPSDARPAGKLGRWAIGSCRVTTSADVARDQWTVDGEPRFNLDPYCLTDAIVNGAREVVVPENYAPVVTALAGSSSGDSRLAFTRVQATDGSPLWRGKIGTTTIVTAANLSAPRWMDDKDERSDLTPAALAAQIVIEAEELVVPESYAPILTALAEARVPVEGLLKFARQLERDLFRSAPQVLAGVSAAARGPLFENGARVRFRDRPTNEGDPFVVVSSCYFGEGEEPGEWRYSLSLDGSPAKKLTDGPFPESKLAMADFTAAEATRRVMRAYGLKVPLRESGKHPEGSFHYIYSATEDLLPGSSDGIQATDALALWKSLAARGFEVDLEHVLRHGKRGEPSFYRLRVRLRQLGAEDIEKVLGLAKSYQAEIGWHMKGAAEPVMELC